MLLSTETFIVTRFLFIFRLNQGETLLGKLVHVCERILNKLSILQSSKQFLSSVAIKKSTYDIFVSYPTKHGDKMKVVYEILRKHNPELNIFYDKLELQTGEKNDKTSSRLLYLSLSVCCLSIYLSRLLAEFIAIYTSFFLIYFYLFMYICYIC